MIVALASLLVALGPVPLAGAAPQAADEPADTPPGQATPTAPEGLGLPPNARSAILPLMPASEAALLLPDLQTLPPTDISIELLSGDRRRLRLANTVWNSGSGRLELAGALNPASGQTLVHQRVYADDGTVHERLVGEFVWHPTHEHFHIEGFAIYELLSLTPLGELDEVVASSNKVSYCIIDTDPADRSHPNFSPRRRYGGCDRALQGLSPGWGDLYRSDLDGQFIDITSLRDGLYALRSTANPERRLLEANYLNNTAIIYVNVRGENVSLVEPGRARQPDCGALGFC